MKLKKILLPVVLVALFAAMTVLLSSCKTDKTTGYVSDEEREAHILYLLGGNTDKLIVADSYPSASNDFESADVTSLGIKDMVKVMDNANYTLYFDFADTSFAVYDKKTKMIYHSDPTNSSQDNVKDEDRNKLHSPLSIEAYDALNKRFEFNFYQDCWADTNYQIMKLDEDTIRIIYTIGNDPDKDLVPPVITVDTWNWIQSQLDKITGVDANGKSLSASYKRSLNDCYKNMTPDTLDLEIKEQYLDYYPTLDYMELYVVRSLNTKQKSLVKTAMEAAGFTVKMLKDEMEKAEYSGPERAVMYTIPVDLTLTDDGISLNVNTVDILAPTKQKLYKIYFYRAFGALNSKTPNPKQYMIIPDGSGAIMPLNGNLTTDVFTARIYGTDQTFNQDVLQTVSETVLSGFGIYDRGVVASETDKNRYYGSMMMVLEDGSAQAFVSARPYNSTNNTVASLNFDLVYSERDYRTYSGGQSSSSGGNEISSTTDSSGNGVVLAKDETVANFVIHYIFGEGGKTYAEYAEQYREYLIKNGKIPSATISDASLQLYLDLMASFEKSESVVGVPVLKKTSLTSYNDVKTILEKLSADGVEDVNVRYLYWSNNGIFNTIFDKVKLLDCLGSKKELSSLVSYCSDSGFGFFPNVDFMYIYRDKLTDGLNYTQDAARRLDMRLARLNERNLATGVIYTDANTYQTILSPDLIPELAASYEKSYSSVVGNGQIALGMMGKYLNSNYKNKRNVNRTKSIEYQLQAFDIYDNYELMVDTGNDYTWYYAKHIVNLPVGSSEYLSEKASIPFIQMVLHGYVYYASEAFNLSADYNTQLLNCLETGSNIIFKWMAADDTIFYNTDFNDYYSLNYENTYDKALAIYKELDPIFDKISALPITDHYTVNAIIPGGTFRYLEEGETGYKVGQQTVDTSTDTRVSVPNVYRSVYGDKYSVYVNYNSFDVQVDLEDGSKLTVKANGYLFDEIK